MQSGFVKGSGEVRGIALVCHEGQKSPVSDQNRWNSSFGEYPMHFRWGALLWLLLLVCFITATYMTPPCSPDEPHLQLSPSLLFPLPILAPLYFEQRDLGCLDMLGFPVVWLSEKLTGFAGSSRCALGSICWCPAEPGAADSAYRQWVPAQHGQVPQ